MASYSSRVRFSKRHGLKAHVNERQRDEVPDGLRYFVFQTSLELGVYPWQLVKLASVILRQRQDDEEGDGRERA